MLEEIRQKLLSQHHGHLAKKREQLKHLTMPELSEVIEGAQNGVCVNSSTPAMHIITENVDTPSKSPAFPNLPDRVLESLGLSKPKQNSPEPLTAQEIEDKFASLSLAFKTDKLTLEKRLQIQERSRDLAEQNVEKELQGIRGVVDALIQLCDKEEMFELVKQLQNRLEILEQSTVRVSSRAEVYGAVQQEGRMSAAMDVMVQHVENLHKVHEKEHIELQEARKFLQDNRVYTMQGSDIGSFDNPSLSKRSFSLAGNLQMKGTRRRNSVSVLPKMLGGSGTPFSLSQSSSMDSTFGMDSTAILSNTSGECVSQDEQDPKTRFQCAVVNTTVRSAVTGAMRRTSIDRLPVILSSSLNKQSVMSEKNDKSSDIKNGSEVQSKPEGKKSEEDAFQRGFEQGVRAHLGREMSELREQQHAFSDTLEDIMDDNELSPEEAERDKNSVFERIQQVCPKWKDNSQRIRLIMAGFVGLMAVFSMVFTILPVGSTNVTRSQQNNSQT